MYFYWRSNDFFFLNHVQIFTVKVCSSWFVVFRGRTGLYFLFFFNPTCCKRLLFEAETSFWTELKRIIRNHLGTADKQSKARPEPIWGLTKQQRVNQDEIYGCVCDWCERMSVLEFTVRLPGNPPPPHWMLDFNASGGCEWNLQLVNSAANTPAFQVTSVQFPLFFFFPFWCRFWTSAKSSPPHQQAFR